MARKEQLVADSLDELTVTIYARRKGKDPVEPTRSRGLHAHRGAAGTTQRVPSSRRTCRFAEPGKVRGKTARPRRCLDRSDRGSSLKLVVEGRTQRPGTEADRPEAQGRRAGATRPGS